ncbi:hypothetical protein FCV25MIE_01222 [Fagus crenata]
MRQGNIVLDHLFGSQKIEKEFIECSASCACLEAEIGVLICNSLLAGKRTILLRILRSNAIIYLAHVEPKEEKPRVKDIEPKQGIEMKEDTKKLKMAMVAYRIQKQLKDTAGILRVKAYLKIIPSTIAEPQSLALLTPPRWLI